MWLIDNIKNSLLYGAKLGYEFPKNNNKIKECYIKTLDGHVLHCWYYINKDKTHFNLIRPFILFCHGNGGNITFYQYFYDYFIELGYSFISFDYRGYGKSTGISENESIYEDVLDVYNYLIKKMNIISYNIIPFGFSLGGFPAAKLAYEKKINKLILCGTFSSLSKVADNLLIFPFNKIGSLLINGEFDTKKYLDMYNGKTLIIHSLEDEIVSVDNAYINSSNNKKIKLNLITGYHNNMNIDWNIITKFLKNDFLLL